jgi:hypothetical protein
MAICFPVIKFKVYEPEKLILSLLLWQLVDQLAGQFGIVQLIARLLVLPSQWIDPWIDNS